MVQLPTRRPASRWPAQSHVTARPVDRPNRWPPPTESPTTPHRASPRSRKRCQRPRTGSSKDASISPPCIVMAYGITRIRGIRRAATLCGQPTRFPLPGLTMTARSRGTQAHVTADVIQVTTLVGGGRPAGSVSAFQLLMRTVAERCVGAVFAATQKHLLRLD